MEHEMGTCFIQGFIDKAGRIGNRSLMDGDRSTKKYLIVDTGTGCMWGFQKINGIYSLYNRPYSPVYPPYNPCTPPHLIPIAHAVPFWSYHLSWKLCN